MNRNQDPPPSNFSETARTAFVPPAPGQGERQALYVEAHANILCAICKRPVVLVTAEGKPCLVDAKWIEDRLFMKQHRCRIRADGSEVYTRYPRTEHPAQPDPDPQSAE